MRVRFFDYQIYRKRFFAAGFVVVLLSVLLVCGILSFFVNSWVASQHKEGERAFEDIERRIQSEKQNTEEYVWGIYSSLSLLDDTVSFLKATEEPEYIQLRGQNSIRFSTQIDSFPEYIHKFILRRDSYVKYAFVSSEHGGTKYLGLENYQTVVKYHFSDMVDGASWLIGSYEIQAGGRLGSEVGTISFWVQGNEIFRTQHPYIGEYGVADDQGNLWGVHQTDNPNREQWLMRAGKEPELTGTFWENGNLVFYSRQEGQYGLSYVTAVDLGTLFRANSTMIWLLIFAMALLDITVMGYIYLNVHYDSVFLGYLLGIIENVEKGDFKSAKAMKRPRFQGKDEYSIISTALENMSRALDEYILNEYRLKLKQQETAMRALQHQINPHFLYNTLEAIRAKALTEKNPKTAEAIALLGQLYRDMVRKEDIIFFWEEKDLLETYLKIMQLRYPDSFAYQLMFDDALLQLKTPKFWMQPLAENFFSHGFDRCSEFNILVVTAVAEKDGWRIEVIDNGSGIPQEQITAVNARIGTGDETPGNSIGLRNVYTRLAYYYGKKFTMELRNNSEGGACVSIFIPNKEVSDVHTADRG